MEDNKITSYVKYWYEKIRTYYFSNLHNIFTKKTFLIKFASILFVFILFLYTFILILAPKNFPLNEVFTVHSGDSLKEIGVNLHKENVIKSEFIFRAVAIFLGGEKKIFAGDYLLDKKEDTFTIAKRLVNASFHLEVVKITIPEGWNAFKISDYLSSKIIKFDKTKFLKLALENEGYLFPDTYFISPTSKPEEIIKLMRSNFDKKVSKVDEINNYDKKLEDVIVMASILEGEALPQDRRIVAGILWRRLAIGMPLQVDSTFIYINGKNTYELTLDDLKIDSLYNTYKYKGLPPGPISNPGVDAITASVTPIKTSYLYFLTEKDGTIHYAKTFEEHKVNKERYLK